MQFYVTIRPGLGRKEGKTGIYVAGRSYTVDEAGLSEIAHLYGDANFTSTVRDLGRRGSLVKKPAPAPTPELEGEPELEALVEGELEGEPVDGADPEPAPTAEGAPKRRGRK